MILRSGVSGRNMQDRGGPRLAAVRAAGKSKVCKHGFEQPTELVPKFWDNGDGQGPRWMMVTRVVAHQGCPE